jgi:magnesium transporter
LALVFFNLAGAPWILLQPAPFWQKLLQGDKIDDGEKRPFSFRHRPEKLFSQVHIEGAVNIPLYQLHRRYEELPRNRLLVIMDGTGTQTLLAASYLKRKGFDVKIDQLIIMLRQGMVVTLHTKEVKRFFRVRRYAETLLRKIPQKIALSDKMTLLLIRIIDENNSRNFDYLRGIEEKGDALSKELTDPKVPRTVIGTSIYEMKHALIVYLGGLWATVNTLNALRYGDAELLTDDQKILNKINALIGEVNSNIGLAEHLSEVLASGLEVLQSIYNNQLQILNNRLALLVAYLTIIGTALLVPNTIATVAGNAMFNFSSKDVSWYLSVIVISTVISTFISWWAVKRMGLLPKSPE